VGNFCCGRSLAMKLTRHLEPGAPPEAPVCPSPQMVARRSAQGGSRAGEPRSWARLAKRTLEAPEHCAMLAARWATAPSFRTFPNISSPCPTRVSGAPRVSNHPHDFPKTPNLNSRICLEFRISSNFEFRILVLLTTWGCQARSLSAPPWARWVGHGTFLPFMATGASKKPALDWQLPQLDPAAAISFAPFRLDLRGGRLLRGNEPIPLRPKTWSVLRYLAERPGVLVAKHDLMDAVWPDLAVTESVLSPSIAELRVVLGDRFKPWRIIETVPRRGFRFASETMVPGSGSLVPGFNEEQPGTRDQRPETRNQLFRGSDQGAAAARGMLREGAHWRAAGRLHHRSAGRR